jgi:3-oxoadipyl-CoA thiolase
MQDTTIGWRFINPLMKAQYGVDAMPETAENVAEEYQVSRADQDAFALRSQQRARAAAAAGYFAAEIVPVEVKGGKAAPVIVDTDEHPRPDTTLAALAKLKPIVRDPGTVTAGNASGINDGAAAMILASEGAARRHGLNPRARVLGMASAAVPPPSSSPARTQRRRTASRRGHASSAWPRPRCRRGSWASARCRPRPS